MICFDLIPCPSLEEKHSRLHWIFSSGQLCKGLSPSVGPSVGYFMTLKMKSEGGLCVCGLCVRVVFVCCVYTSFSLVQTTDTSGYWVVGNHGVDFISAL